MNCLNGQVPDRAGAQLAELITELQAAAGQPTAGVITRTKLG